MVAVRDLRADGAAGGKRDHLVGREFPLLQDREHLAPDIAGRADDGDFVTHSELLMVRRTGRS